MKERLRGADYRFIAICVVLLASTTWYAARNFHRAFPEASIDFRVNRDDARQLALRFLTGNGYRLEGYREASSFSFDDDAKTFLEREAGLEQANRLMGTRLRLWRWSYRWFRPLQKEEFQADITPAGEFAGFAHELAEDAPRPAASLEQARALAEEFLRDRLHRDPASLDFVETSSTARPKRTDQVFTWKERDFQLHDATYRVEVTVLGNEVGGYREYLKVPEQWTRAYERLRSKNNAAQQIDLAAAFLLLVGLVIVIARSVRRKDIRWRRASLIGVVGMALSLLSTLNEFPLSEFGYPTTDAYSSFVIRQILEAFLNALALGGLLFVIVAGADVLYRHSYPGQVSVGNLFRPRGLRSKRFFLGAILGITLTGIFIAYQTGFYIVAGHYGAWSPADVPYSDLLNTRFPWLFVLFGGFFPAVFEEFGFRMFAIPFLRKVVRWLPGAVVLAGFLWGFGHAGYPQQPFFIRGLEVGIGGVALGCIMLRWGILPTLVWHYSVDAMYSAMLLLRSHSLYFKLSGAASAGIVVLPVVVALVAYWRRGGFDPDTGLLNSDEPVAEAPPEQATAPVQESSPYLPLPARWRWAAVAILLVGMATLLVRTSQFGESPRLRLTADEARASADQFLRTQSINTEAYKHVTYPATHWGGDDSLAAKYFLERRPTSVAAGLFEQNRPVRYWATRYFQPLNKEEFLVTVHPETGKVTGYHREVPEDQAGTDLTAEAALPVAVSFAAGQGLDVAAMELSDKDSEKRKFRRDYTFTWEARSGDPRNVDEAHYRITVEVAGDRPSTLRVWWKIPEAYERSRSRQTLVSIVVMVLDIGVTASAALLGLWFLVGNIRRGQVRWRAALLLAIAPAAMTAVSAGLSSSVNLYRNYQTSIPFETWRVMMFTSFGTAMLLGAVTYVAMAALLTSFYPESVAAWKAARRRVLGADALTALLAAAGFWLISHQAAMILAERFHAAAIPDIDSPALVGLAAPWLGAIAAAVHAVFASALVVAIAGLAVGLLRRRWVVFPLLLLVAVASVSSEVRTPAEFGLEYAGALLFWVSLWLFCRYFARSNYLAYGLVFWVVALQPAAAEFFATGNAALRLQAWLLVAVMLATVAWAAGPALVQRSTGSQAES